MPSGPLPLAHFGNPSTALPCSWPITSGYPYGSSGRWPLPVNPSSGSSRNFGTPVLPPLGPKKTLVMSETGKTAPAESKGTVPVSRQMPTPLPDNPGNIGSPLLSQEEQDRLIRDLESQLLSWPSKGEEEAEAEEAVGRGCCSRLTSPHPPVDPPVLLTGLDPLAGLLSPVTPLPSSPTPLPMGHLVMPRLG
jgi:hypothetical protein